MEAFKLGKNTHIKMPSGWHEVNYNKAILILKGDLDQFEIFSLLTGRTEKEIRTATDAESLIYLFNAFEFLSRMPEKVNEFPRSVKLGPDRLVFPFVSYADKFDLGKAEVGQVEDMLTMIMKMNTEFIGEDERTELTEIELAQICPFLVAIYLQKILDNEYDGDKAMKLVDRVKEELSFKEVISMGYFFLNRLSHLQNGSVKELSRHRSIRKRLKRALLNLIQRLVSLLP